MELINANTSAALKVLKFTAPTKSTVGSIVLNGEVTETRFTSARGKEYTYFPVNGVSVYVAGKLEEGASYTVEFPEDFKGPAWTSERKSYYVRKRPAKPATEGETNASTDNSPEHGSEAQADASQSGSGEAEPASEATSGEGPAAEDVVEGAEAPKGRRRRA